MCVCVCVSHSADIYTCAKAFATTAVGATVLVSKYQHVTQNKRLGRVYDEYHNKHIFFIVRGTDLSACCTFSVMHSSLYTYKVSSCNNCSAN